MEKIKTFIWKYRWIVLGMQMIVCIFIFLTVYFTQRGTREIDLSHADMTGGHMLDDGGIHIDETDGAYGLYLNVNTSEIKKGCYKIHVAYETGYDDNGFLIRPLNGNPNAINKDVGDEQQTIPLKSQNRNKSVHVWAEEATGLQISFHFCGGGYLDIKGIELEKVADYTPVFLTFFLFLIMDFLFWEKSQVDSEEWRKRNLVRVGIICITLIACIPLMNKYVLMGFDLMGHVARIEGIAEGIASGQFPVRIMPQWWNEYGYAQSVFYGDILLYFPAILLLLNYKFQTAFKCYIAFINLITAWIAYKSFRKIAKDRKIALLGSGFYTLNIFRLMYLYCSNGVGAYTAMAFLPLIIAGIYCMKEEGGWIYLAVGLTGCIQSHLMTCEMTGIFLILFFAAGVKWICQKSVFFNLCKAGVAVVLWNLWFLIPFLNLYMGEYKFKVMGDFQTNIQWDGIGVGDWFRAVLASLNGETDTLRLGCTIGLAAGFGLLFVLVFLVLDRGEGAEDVKRSKIHAGILGGAAGAALFLSTKYFPYDFLCAQSTVLATLIHSLQFPWRFLEIAVILAVTTIVLGFVIWRKLGYKKVCILMAGFLGCCCLLDAAFYYHRLLVEAPHKTEMCEYYAFPEYMGVVEYLPVMAETLYERHELSTSDDQVEIESYEKKYTTIWMSCTNHGSQEAYIDVPLFFYPCYKAKDVKTGESLSLTYGENAKIRIILPPGYQGGIKLEVNPRRLWKIADMISLISIVIAVFILIKEKRGKIRIEGVGR